MVYVISIDGKPLMPCKPVIARLLKQISTYRIWRQNNNYLDLSKEFWKEQTFWSDGYFVCSIGNVSKEVIEKYIQEQG